MKHRVFVVAIPGADTPDAPFPKLCGCLRWQLPVRQRTMLSNAIRGHMAELGIVSAKAVMAPPSCLRFLLMCGTICIPVAARLSPDALARQYANSRQRSESSRSISRTGIDRARKADGSRRCVTKRLQSFRACEPQVRFECSEILERTLERIACRVGAGAGCDRQWLGYLSFCPSEN
jgi:hypothetical protein